MQLYCRPGSNPVVDSDPDFTKLFPHFVPNFEYKTLTKKLVSDGDISTKSPTDATDGATLNAVATTDSATLKRATADSATLNAATADSATLNAAATTGSATFNAATLVSPETKFVSVEVPARSATEAATGRVIRLLPPIDLLQEWQTCLRMTDGDNSYEERYLRQARDLSSLRPLVSSSNSYHCHAKNLVSCGERSGRFTPNTSRGSSVESIVVVAKKALSFGIRRYFHKLRRLVHRKKGGKRDKLRAFLKKFGSSNVEISFHNPYDAARRNLQIDDDFEYPSFGHAGVEVLDDLNYKTYIVDNREIVVQVGPTHWGPAIRESTELIAYQEELSVSSENEICSHYVSVTDLLEDFESEDNDANEEQVQILEELTGIALSISEIGILNHGSQIDDSQASSDEVSYSDIEMRRWLLMQCDDPDAYPMAELTHLEPQEVVESLDTSIKDEDLEEAKQASELSELLEAEVTPESRATNSSDEDRDDKTNGDDAEAGVADVTGGPSELKDTTGPAMCLPMKLVIEMEPYDPLAVPWAHVHERIARHRASLSPYTQLTLSLSVATPPTPVVVSPKPVATTLPTPDSPPAFLPPRTKNFQLNFPKMPSIGRFFK